MTKQQLIETFLEFCDEKEKLIAGIEAEQYTFGIDAFDCAATNIIAQIESPLPSNDEDELCRYCGGKLIITDKDEDHKKCNNCGAEYWWRDDENLWRSSPPDDDEVWRQLEYSFRDMAKMNYDERQNLRKDLKSKFHITRK